MWTHSTIPIILITLLALSGLFKEVLSWDRGWNAEGRQVWGAESGGYVFMKVEGKEETPPED